MLAACASRGDSGRKARGRDDLAGVANDCRRRSFASSCPRWPSAALPVAAAGGQDDVPVRSQVHGFCSSAPVAKWIASSSHTAMSGVTCGRPSARTVETQNSSAPLESGASLFPACRDCVLVAESCVELGYRLLRQLSLSIRDRPARDARSEQAPARRRRSSRTPPPPARAEARACGAAGVASYRR